MKSTHIFIAILGGVIVLVGGYFYFTQKTASTVIAPTSDAPNSVVLPMGHTGRVGDILITFNSVVEDSRCPAGVMCIQAGSVTANVTLTSGGKTETFNLPQDQVPHEFNGYHISIKGAEPLKRQHGEIAQSEYVVTFGVLPFIRATYTCDAGRFIVATYAGDEVHLTLNDAVGGERQMYLPRAISASGARYSTNDESFVFWNKGDTATITEVGSRTTFANCLDKN